jgi:hypothetical protein
MCTREKPWGGLKGVVSIAIEERVLAGERPAVPADFDAGLTVRPPRCRHG